METVAHPGTGDRVATLERWRAEARVTAIYARSLTAARCHIPDTCCPYCHCFLYTAGVKNSLPHSRTHIKVMPLSTQKSHWLRVACALAITLSPLVARAESRIAADIGYRKDVMMAMDWNLVRVADMLRHTRPYNQSELVSETRALAALSQMSWAAFVPGSDRGFTKAKPSIWQHPKRFQAQEQRFEQATAFLAATARQGNLRTTGIALEKVAHGCHSCHVGFKR